MEVSDKKVKCIQKIEPHCQRGNQKTPFQVFARNYIVLILCLISPKKHVYAIIPSKIHQ